MAEDKTQNTLETSKSRIIYTEPNFVNSSTLNGTEFSVPLDDLCISVNLIAEVKTRFMSDLSEGSTELNVMSWSSVDSEKVSFFSGIKLDRNSDDRYLTSYFTDISYEDSKDGKIIEGLGIDSIDINFESWYTPTIVIKFIDVRGSSMLIPNEYDSNTNNSTYYTSDKLYKCFFTFPYPKFKLLVKGFYGKPVTFQLTCSKFSGSFNSQNGNFEATATFIGYNYSLLTDIQLQYLVAAPYDTYFGQKYFNSKRSSESWLLSDGVEMPTLKELIYKIDSAIGIIDEKMATDPTVVENRTISSEKELLHNIQNAYYNMFRQLESDINLNGRIISVNNKQCIFGINSVTDSGDITYTEEFINKQNQFIDLINEYNTNDSFKNRIINNNKLPNNTIKKLLKQSSFMPREAFLITKKDGIIDQISVIGGKTDWVNVLKNRTYNDKLKIDSGLINDVVDKCKMKSDVIRTYIYLYNKNGFDEEINTKLTYCDNRLANMQSKMDVFVKNSVKETIGFVPTVGNMSKILFAHLETFLQSMFYCVNSIRTEIKNGGRTLSSYKIKLDDTDINSIGENSSIPPFPLYLDRGYKTSYCGDKDENMDVIGWIGDKKGDCEEVQLIYGYIKALEMITEIDKSNTRELDNIGKIQDYIPICPLDLNYDKGPFTYSNVNGETLEDFIGHIGLRATLLFGFLFNTKGEFDRGKMTLFAEQAGKADAYNYYLRGMTKDEINSRILNKLGKSGERTVNDIVEVLQCSNDSLSQYYQGSQSSNYIFELIKGGTHNNRERNAIFVETTDNKLVYSYIFVNSDEQEIHGVWLLPTQPKNFKDYISDYVSGVKDNPFKIPLLENNNNRSCITINDYTLPYNYNGNLDLDVYTNTSVCNIINDDVKVTQIMNRYKDLKSGEINIKDYKKTTDLSLLADLLWKVDDEYIKSYYDINWGGTGAHVGTGGWNVGEESFYNRLIYNKLGNDKKILILPPTMNELLQVKNMDVWKFKDWKLNGKMSDGEIVVNTLNNQPNNIDDFTIPEIPILENNIVNSLFGHPFYYMQNYTINENETDYDRIDRSTKSKALLLLHSLSIKYDNLKIFNDLKNGLTYRIPRAVVLFIGGLCWRKRYSIEKRIDDVFIYDDGINNFKKPKSKNEYTYETILYNPLKNGVIDINNWGIDINDYFKYPLISMRYPIENKFIEEFNKWSVDVNGFKSIQKECELFNSDGSILTALDLLDYNTEWVNVFGNGTNESLLRVPTAVHRFFKKLASNFITTYASFYSTKGNKSFRLLFREDTNVQNNIKDLYYSTNILTISTYAVSGERNKYSHEILIDKDLTKTYFNSIVNTLELIVNDKSVVNKEDDQPINLADNRDINIAMYSYLKNIYDKWLTGIDTTYFDVNRFFNNNFIFVDSFYRNIRDKMIINCDYFSKRYHEMADTSTLYSYLADLYAHHGMLFTPMSHFLNWAEEDVLKDMFKPMPHNSMPPMEEDNKFICMYIHEPSKNLDMGVGNTSYGYKPDGFDIWTPENGTEMQPRIFSQKIVNGDIVDESSLDTRYAYNIPSFGVAFGKANQTYFKNISVNMDNPITTEYSIKSIWKIAELAKNSTTKVQFVGQDLYSVWSNYSFTCEVEMMGCAQIQPLMYFQLLNIPMFRGTYIITKVSHHLSPGGMTTNFTGVKLSRNGQPFNTMPFGMLGVLYKNNKGYFGELTNSNSISYDNNISSNNSYSFTPPEEIIISPDDCGCQNGSGWNTLSDIMKKLFYALKSSVESMLGNESGKLWTICISSGHRPNAKSGDHKTGDAMDIQIKRNGILIGKGENKNELGIVFDIIVTTYSEYINKLIIEYPSVSIMKNNFNMIHTIHFSSYGKDGTETLGKKNNKWIWQSYNPEGDNVKSLYNKNNNFTLPSVSVNNKKTNNILIRDNNDNEIKTKKAEESLSFISTYYKNTTKKRFYSFLPNKLANFKNIFTSYSGVDDETLKYFFGVNNSLYGISYLSLNKKSPEFKNQVRCNDVNAFVKRISEISQEQKFNPNWLMVVMASESGIDPSEYNKNSRATGLIQFMPSYYESVEWNLTSDQLRKMDATEQLEYVDKYFSKLKKTWGKIKYIHPVDMYLATLSPAILAVDDRNSSSVIYSKMPDHPSVIPNIGDTTKQYNGNKSIDLDNKGYITIKDVQNRFTTKAHEFANTSDEKSQLDYILTSSTYI